MRVSPKGVEASKKVVGKGRHLTVNTLSISAYSLLPSFTKFCPIIMRSFSVHTHLDTYQKKKTIQFIKTFPWILVITPKYLILGV